MSGLAAIRKWWREYSIECAALVVFVFCFAAGSDEAIIFVVAVSYSMGHKHAMRSIKDSGEEDSAKVLPATGREG